MKEATSLIGGLSLDWLSVAGLSLDWHELSRQFVLTAAHYLWQGFFAGLLLAMALKLLRDRTVARPGSRQDATVTYAAGRHAAACVALFALPICFVVTFAWVHSSGKPIVVRRTTQAGPVETMEHPETSLPKPTGALSTNRMPTHDLPAISSTGVRSEPQAIRTSVIPDQPLAGAFDGNAWLAGMSPWVFVAYLVGAAIMLLRLGCGVIGGQRLKTTTQPIADAAILNVIREQAKRIGLSRIPIVALCERVSVPVVVGIFKPLVLLPPALLCGLDVHQVAAILSHEFAHIRRWDLLLNLLQRIVESLFFFHPITWWISRHVSIERENCCDDQAARGCGRIDYAGALLRMAELCASARGLDVSGRLHALAADGNAPSQLSYRIHRLLGESPNVKVAITRSAIGSIAAAALLCGVSLVALAQNAPTPEPSPVAQERPASGDERAEKSNVAAETPAETADKEPKAKDPVTDDRPLKGPLKLLEPAFRLPEHFTALAVGFDKDSAELIAVSPRGFATIRRWDVAGKKLKSEIKLAGDKHGRPYREYTLTLSADRRKVVAATDDYVGVWDTTTGELLKMLPVPQEEWRYGVDHLACSADASVIVASLGYSSTAKFHAARLIVWDGPSGEIRQNLTVENGGDLLSIAVSPDGKLLATTSGHESSIWDANSGKRLHALRKDDCYFWTLGFSPDGKLLATSDDRGVKLFDAQSGKLRRELNAPGRYSVAKLIFSKDGQLLARTGTIWSTQTGKMLYDLVTRPLDGSFSDDNTRYAVASSESGVGLAVWQLSGDATRPGAEQPATALAEPDTDRVDDNAPYRGQKAEELIDALKPVWSETALGVQLGVALTGPPRPFHRGQRVPLAVFFRNVSDKPLQIDFHPNFYWDTPQVINAQGAAVEFEKIPLLGDIPHYRIPDYRDNLAPGEAYGPFYFNFGLGQNPRPGEQVWTPFYKAPVAGPYKLTTALAIKVAAPDDGDPSTKDEWQPADLQSREIEFEIVDEDN